MALEPRVAVVRHIAISTAVVPTVVMTKITLAAVIAVVLVIAATVIVVPCWNDHAASERDGEDRKNEDVSHVGLSVENNSMNSGCEKRFRKNIHILLFNVALVYGVVHTGRLTPTKRCAFEAGAIV